MNNTIWRLSAQTLASALFLLSAFPAWAQPVLNPGNGTYYELITGGSWNWQQAADDAQTRSFNGQIGHLAAITSQAENDFLENDMNIPQNSWIGLTQDPAGAEPAGGWGWITGEAFSFTSWAPGEPNDSGANEDCGHWWTPDGTWNDIPCTNVYGSYVIEYAGGAVPSRTTFAVSKDFNDGNPAEVEVTISCNTGLPLQQTTSISEGDGVVFVVRDFNDGELDCEVTEAVPDGYAVEYFDGDVDSPDSCAFEDVGFGDANVCEIFNDLLSVDVDVTKEWIDENPQFQPFDVAQADYSCANEVFNQVSGSLFFSGNPDTESFSVFPNWNGSTTCTVTEDFLEGGVEADDSDCQSMSVTPGNGASCTIVNTRLFEGIPTLSQYGLALLAMLMLGVGFVAYRRSI